MEFNYRGLKGKFIDFEVVKTGWWFTWIRLKYELYNDEGTIIEEDWTDHWFGTYGCDPEFEDEDYDEDGEVKLTDEEIIEYVDNLFHDGYEFDDVIEGIKRVDYKGWGDWDPIESVEDICKELFDIYFL